MVVISITPKTTSVTIEATKKNNDPSIISLNTHKIKKNSVPAIRRMFHQASPRIKPRVNDAESSMNCP